MNDTGSRRRSKAGLSTLRQHRKKMLPRSYPSFGALLVAALVTVLTYRLYGTRRPA